MLKTVRRINLNVGVIYKVESYLTDQDLDVLAEPETEPFFRVRLSITLIRGTMSHRQELECVVRLADLQADRPVRVAVDYTLVGIEGIAPALRRAVRKLFG